MATRCSCGGWGAPWPISLVTAKLGLVAAAVDADSRSRSSCSRFWLRARCPGSVRQAVRAGLEGAHKARSCGPDDRDHPKCWRRQAGRTVLDIVAGLIVATRCARVGLGRGRGQARPAGRGDRRRGSVPSEADDVVPRSRPATPDREDPAGRARPGGRPCCSHGRRHSTRKEAPVLDFLTPIKGFP